MVDEKVEGRFRVEVLLYRVKLKLAAAPPTRAWTDMEEKREQTHLVSLQKRPHIILDDPPLNPQVLRLTVLLSSSSRTRTGTSRSRSCKVVELVELGEVQLDEPRCEEGALGEILCVVVNAATSTSAAPLIDRRTRGTGEGRGTHRLLQPLQPRHKIIPQRIPLSLLNEPEDDLLERLRVRLSVRLGCLDVPTGGEEGVGFGREDEGAVLRALWATSNVSKGTKWEDDGGGRRGREGGGRSAPSPIFSLVPTHLSSSRPSTHPALPPSLPVRRSPSRYRARSCGGGGRLRA